MLCVRVCMRERKLSEGNVQYDKCKEQRPLSCYALALATMLGGEGWGGGILQQLLMLSDNRGSERKEERKGRKMKE